MNSIERLTSLPLNIDRFIEENASGLGHLYGALAEMRYRERALPDLGAMIRHAAVSTYGCMRDGNAHALLMSVDRKERLEHITQVHVLSEYQGQALERSLVEEAVQAMRKRGATEILCEGTNFCELDLEQTFKELDFKHVARSIMIGDLDSELLSGPISTETRLLEAGEEVELGRLLYEAYIGHPGSDLHREVRSAKAAVEFVRGVTRCDYGYSAPEYTKVMLQERRFVGGILGCEIAPDVGFIMQLAVDPGWRNGGIGKKLVRETCAAFRDRGLRSVALGVTEENPARELYEKLGLVKKFAIDAYSWRATV